LKQISDEANQEKVAGDFRMTKVLVTGIFDLLHVEHVRFLAAAKNLVQNSEFRIQNLDECYLIVGIESDVRVRKLKGAGRPIMKQEDRKEMLAGLAVVDEVFILPEDFDNDAAYEKILKEVKADIYAVSENSPYMENKRKICEKAGVKCMVVTKFNPEYSTSKIVNRILGFKD
jgi:cytidyltransferase-like protein